MFGLYVFNLYRESWVVTLGMHSIFFQFIISLLSSLSFTTLFKNSLSFLSVYAVNMVLPSIIMTLELYQQIIIPDRIFSSLSYICFCIFASAFPYEICLFPVNGLYYSNIFRE